MYFINRFELGGKLAGFVSGLRGSEPIVIPLKESSLSACIALATEIRGWVYPLLTEQVRLPGDPRIIGVINQDGTMCYNPELSEYDIEAITMEFRSALDEESRLAFSRLNSRTSDYGTLNKDALRGRTVILCGDIVRDRVELEAAKQLLKPIATQKIIGLVGNITPNGSDELFLETQESKYLDILEHMFDDDHYFEEADKYTLPEQRLLAMNIAHYWK
ncbi:MAG: hypothetical protein WBP26_00770 [Candidatus Saccharimonadales bacterium]